MAPLLSTEIVRKASAMVVMPDLRTDLAVSTVTGEGVSLPTR
jgi:hypothetical protein